VWALFVVVDAEAMEHALLCGAGGCGRKSRLGLQSSTHAFVSAVLLGVGGLDGLRSDAEFYPPSRKTRDATDGLCGEWDAVVAADYGGQAVLAEEALEDRLSELVFGRDQGLASEQVAAEAVDDGERVAVTAIAGFEVTFEVCGPHGVGRPWRRAARRDAQGESIGVEDA